MLIAFVVVIACGGSTGDESTDSVQQDPTSTPYSVPAEATSQQSTQTTAPSTTTAPTLTNATATAVPTTPIATAASSPTEMPAATAEPSREAVQSSATAAPEPTATQAPPTAAPAEPTSKVVPERDFDVVTLLAPDAIPALNNPGYHDTTEAADESYQDDDLVLGIEINGDARAFSVPLLSRHEIVNDVIGGEPVAVTW